MICCRKNDKNFRFWVFWAKILLKKLSFYSKICEENVEKLEVANLVSFGLLYVRQFSLDWCYVFSSAREGSLQQALALAPGRASAREALVRSTLPRISQIPQNPGRLIRWGRQRGRNKIRVDVRREGSLPSLALPSVWEGQALAARILPLPSEKIEITILGLKCNVIRSYLPKLPVIKKSSFQTTPKFLLWKLIFLNKVLEN